MPSAPLSGKTLLLTGGSRGIGAAIAVAAAKAGANIVLASKTMEPHPKLPGTLPETVAACKKAGAEHGVDAIAIQADVRDTDQIDHAVKTAVDRFGRIDIVVNNAGAINLMPVEMLELKRFDLMNQINLRAPYYLDKICIEHLRKSDNAHILHLSPPIDMSPHWFDQKTPYTISKYGMSMLTIGLSEELRVDGIAVNSLWPRTTIATAAVNMLGGQPMLDASRTPEIMADAALEIMTSDSKELTGQHLLDEPFLRSRGVTDFDRYAATPGAELQLDFYVSE